MSTRTIVTADAHFTFVSYEHSVSSQLDPESDLEDVLEGATRSDVLESLVLLHTCTTCGRETENALVVIVENAKNNTYEGVHCQDCIRGEFVGFVRYLGDIALQGETEFYWCDGQSQAGILTLEEFVGRLDRYFTSVC
ncbi:MAG TPA: hypothetical protein DD670_11395 [Planctomycetaceae bacterium]|nr:hypothetical protein [Planctomycetaceae bacterium]